MLFSMPEPIRFTTGFPGLPVGIPSKQEHRERVFAFKTKLRRQAQLRAAADVLPHLPGPGESVHTLLTGTFDFMLVLSCVIQSQPSQCHSVTIATLAFSRRNTQELTRLLDAKKVDHLTLLCSDFMAKSNPEIYHGAVEELVEARGQVLASSRCHAKVACLSFSDGLHLVFEGSANLRTNKNIEQMTVINDTGLHDWHTGWIQQKVQQHEINKSRGRT